MATAGIVAVAVTAGPSVASASSEGTVRTAPTARSAACPTGWGSLPESNAGAYGATLTGVRSGRHTCFDRLVLDLAGPASGYDVRYVSAVREDGSGRLVPLRGGADLRVIAQAPAYDPESGAPTYRPAVRSELVNVTGYRTFRQVAWAGTFEGQTTVGLGVRARLPFRVFTLGSPSRLVIDVAHSW